MMAYLIIYFSSYESLFHNFHFKMTTGGTESLLLACYAYRNLAYSQGIDRPEM